MSKRRVDMYGIKGVTLEKTRSMVEEALGIELEELDDGHFGGLFYRYQDSASREIRLYSNFDATRSEWIVGQSREYSIFLRVTCLENMDEIQRRLQAFSDDFVLLGSSAIEKQ